MHSTVNKDVPQPVQVRSHWNSSLTLNYMFALLKSLEASLLPAATMAAASLLVVFQLLSVGLPLEHCLYRHTSLYCTLLSCISQMLHFFFLQIEGKILHQQKGYESLYCNTRFIDEVWNQTRNISKVCLYFIWPRMPKMISITKVSVLRPLLNKLEVKDQKHTFI
uniref:Uncharacterized protein n=1 Tax=Rousettus aegyptiacus TaxID=9407 RepID=A0A7J8HRW7_ROUAE|nr:hypothetical protein HJG63_010956 [Rousettus aegyptiacus]